MDSHQTTNQLAKLTRIFTCCLMAAPCEAQRETMQTSSSTLSQYSKKDSIVRCPGYELFWAANGVAVRIFLAGVRRDDICMHSGGKHIEIWAVKTLETDETILDDTAIRKQQVIIKQNWLTRNNTTTTTSFHEDSDNDFLGCILYKIRFRVNSTFDTLLSRIDRFEGDVLTLIIPLRANNTCETPPTP